MNDPLPWPRRPGPVLSWLVREGARVPEVAELLRELAERLVAESVPLARVTLHVRTLHPLILGEGYFWQKATGDVVVRRVGHDTLDTPVYTQSPMYMLFEGIADAVRQRLDVEGSLPFALYDDLRAEGLTDYVALPLVTGDRPRMAMTFATDRPGGFSTEDLIRLDDLIPVLTPILETHEIRAVAVNIVNTYVGPRAGRRVLEGRIRRGDGETISAAIWYCDLRDFTALSSRHDRDTVIRILNAYFEAMAEPVARYGGETLKFIGDALLAVFPMGQEEACIAALEAAKEAAAAMHALNRRQAEHGFEPLGFGIALHIGDVMYGNIGAPDRLDFTVIGPAVNVAVRLQELCKTLGYEIVASAEFAGLAPLRYQRVGQHRLRGVPRPVTVFVPYELAETGQSVARPPVAGTG